MQGIDKILGQVAATEIGYYTDYNFAVQNSPGLSLAGPLAAQITPVAGNKAGCVVAIYRREPAAPPETQPLVWLDSEGSPNGIFAQHLNAFLCLIPFGSGLIYDVLTHCLASYQQHGLAPMQGFEALAAGARSCMQPACEEYRRWLSQRGLEEEKDPVGAIRDAFLIEPGFEDKLMQPFTRK